VIQQGFRPVCHGMQVAVRSPFPTGMWQASYSLHSPRVLMATDDDLAKAGKHWEHLIRMIAACQDRSSFAALFSHFAPRIKTFMQRSGASEARAEELAQETMLTIWRKAALFNPDSASAATWIFTIARNLRIDAFRREHRGGMTEISDIEIEFKVDDSPLPDAGLASAQTEQRVRAALQQLSDDQMRVIELSFFDEKAHGEIAKILNIPLGTVKSRLRLALKKLRNSLGQHS
jgi:RNA polymerase sigma-70 factor (ECF subfamily)